MHVRWMGVVSCGVLLGGVTLGLAAQAPRSTPGKLRLDSLQTTVVHVPQGRIAQATRGPSGDFYLLSSDAGSISRLGPDGEVKAILHLASITDLLGIGTQPGANFAVGPGDSVYVPLLWRPNLGKPRDTHAGLAVFSPNGSYRARIVFDPPVEIRRAAVDPLGNLYVLGMDPSFFQQELNSCYLIHKYSPDGKRLDSFSSCSQAAGLRGERTQLGPGFRRLQAEADRGQVWLTDSRVYHLLPLSRTLRIFEPEGKLVAEVRFESPWAEWNAAQPLSIWIWNVAPLADGNYLVEWLRSERDGARALNSRHQTIHDSGGRVLSLPVPMVASTGTLLSGDGQGLCYLLGKDAAGRIVVRQARASLE